ncbi:hypothetical protein PG988_003822 [Apiospora saccharicola]
MVFIKTIVEPLFRWQGSNERSPDLEWIESTESLIPRIHELLCMLLPARWDLALSPGAVSVQFLSEGAWNRAFRVTIRYDGCLPQSCPLTEDVNGAPGSYSAVFRLSVPIEKSLKTLSEVATLQWVKYHTEIPVPRVFMYDGTGDSFGGYEWILMEHMPGQPFSSVRDSLTTDAKTSLAKTIAEWVHALWSTRYAKIGGLYKPDDIKTLEEHYMDEGGMSTNGVRDGIAPADKPNVTVSQLCNQQYMGDWRPEYSLNKGPFHDLRSFCLSFVHATRAELRDVRQKQRAEIEELCNKIYDDDLECIADKPALSIAKRNRTRRYLETETAAERETRHRRLEATKAELETQMESLFPGKGAEAWRSAMGLFYRESTAALDVSVNTPRPLPNDTEHVGCIHRESTAPLDVSVNAARRQQGAPKTVGCIRANGLVTYQQCRYELERWEHHESIMERLAHVIQTVVPDERLPEGSCVLHHWDISENNVLVDAEGRPTALLDWEQMFTIPILPLINSANSANMDCPGTGDAAAEGPSSPSVESLMEAVPLPPILKPIGNRSEYRYSHEPSPSRIQPWQSLARETESWQMKQMRLAYTDRLRELFVADSSRSSADYVEVWTFNASEEVGRKGWPMTSVKRNGWSNKAPGLNEEWLVKKILTEVPNTWMGPSFVEELVLEAEDALEELMFDEEDALEQLMFEEQDAFENGWSNKSPGLAEEWVTGKILTEVPDIWMGPPFVEELVLEAEDALRI